MLLDLSSDIRRQKRMKSEMVQKDAASAAVLRASWLLANNPYTSAEVLERLSKQNHVAILERVVQNPATHSSTVLALTAHEATDVRAAIAENINLPIKTAWRLARDHSPDVRYRLAENYTIPPAVLKVLCEDENPYVAYRARITISRLLAEARGSMSA